ncbi:hypothetical protein Adt_44218 [Abeliophyllum distichum]|uniref:Uncharacterized protein n=1 Tax=Abeliophyllum distichum TaxID=126358 RepID=A0ABD1PA75_9LAMI
MLAVLELHRNTNVLDLHKEKPKNFDHLVLETAAGTKALNKTHFRTNGSQNGNNVAFAIVFAIYNSIVDRQVNDRPVDLVTMPQSNIVILTDPAAELPVHRDRVSVHPMQGLPRNKALTSKIRGR